MELVEIRVRTKIPQAELEKKVGKIITEADYNVRLTGPTRVIGPSGQPLAVYLPGVLSGTWNEEHYPTLHTIKQLSDTRGNASGSQYRMKNKQSHANQIASSVIGHFDGSYSTPRTPYCRTTAWTGQHTEQFRSMYPLFEHIGGLMREYVPERHAIQWARAQATDPAWRVPNTPFTTMTVNNTYPTGVHKDKGDLDTGFSCLAVWRRGQYSGGHLTLPEYRVSVDMQDGDLLLMDAHQWHGNTGLELHSEDAERISLVLYYRTALLQCGTVEEEHANKVRFQQKTLKPPSEAEMDADAMAETVTTAVAQHGRTTRWS